MMAMIKSEVLRAEGEFFIVALHQERCVPAGLGELK
jgi:hypothetical protein